MTVLGFHLPHSVSFWLQGSNVSLVLSACLNLPGASWVIGILTVTHFTEHRGFFRTRLSSLFIKLLNCLASNNFYCLLQPITVKRLQQPLPLLHNTTPIITISGTVASILLLLYCCKACHHYYWECFFFPNSKFWLCLPLQSLLPLFLLSLCIFDASRWAFLPDLCPNYDQIVWQFVQ